MTVREIVLQRMRDLGWNNAKLARESGLSATYIGQIVNDHVPNTRAGRPVNWSIETLTKISAALSIPLDILKDAAGLKTESRSRIPEEDELLAYMQELPEDKRSDVLAIVRTLLANYRKQKTQD